MPVRIEDPDTFQLRYTHMDPEIRKILEVNGVDTLGQLIEHDEWELVNWLAKALEQSGCKPEKITPRAIEQLEKLRAVTDYYCVCLFGKRHTPFQLGLKFREEEGS